MFRPIVFLALCAIAVMIAMPEARALDPPDQVDQDASTYIDENDTQTTTVTTAPAFAGAPRTINFDDEMVIARPRAAPAEFGNYPNLRANIIRTNDARDSLFVNNAQTYIAFRSTHDPGARPSRTALNPTTGITGSVVDGSLTVNLTGVIDPNR